MKTQRGAFTLIELLVVIAIIGILASLMLPGILSAKAKAKTATCINSLRQIGIALKLYVEENDSTYPPNSVLETNLNPKTAWATLGGYDPTDRYALWFPSATVRPLYSYLKPSEVFRCPEDEGQRCIVCPTGPLEPSDFSAVGCSYHYNGGQLATIRGGGFKEEVAGGLALQRESWMPRPDKYIVMHEPAARLYPGTPLDANATTLAEIEAGGFGTENPLWYQWHYNLGRSVIDDPKYARQKFISPILFGDGHVAVHNFSKSLSTDPLYPYEETKEWMWYKPKEKEVASGAQ